MNFFREAGFALGSWLVPFVCGGFMAILLPYPSRSTVLLYCLGVAAATLLLGCIYLRDETANYMKHGKRIGAIWTATNLAFSGILATRGAHAMAIDEYTQNIGIIYAIIPAITIGLGYMGDVGAQQQREAE